MPELKSGHTFAIEQLLPEHREAIYAHAEREQPRECCGLLVREPACGAVLYLPAANLCAEGGHDRFRLDPMTYAEAEEIGQVLAVVHSHPNASANPSMADRVGCERSALTWLVMGWPSGVVKAVSPEGWQAPYKGREFCHGVLDCYTLIQDWYLRELRIELPDFEREDGWWEPARGEDLYMRHYREAGFERVDGPPQRHDVILMQVRSDQANHGAVYLGDGVLLHHLHGRLSCEDVYGGYWERHTLALLRHRSRTGALAMPLQAAA
jgi:proteasome lid subunit RPN8/RPN11